MSHFNLHHFGSRFGSTPFSIPQKFIDSIETIMYDADIDCVGEMVRIGELTEYSDVSDYPLNPGFLAYVNTHYQVDEMFEYVRDWFAPFPNVEVVKGFLPDSLALACPERIGYLLVDLNSPRAEVAVLEQLFDKMVPGGVIFFDDYGWKLFEKQKESEDVFMKARGYEILELPTTQGLVVKR
jgi:hypothetical protein